MNPLRPFLLPCLVLSFCLPHLLAAQGIGTVNLSSSLYLERFVALSSGKFIGWGTDTLTSNHVVTQFDQNFDPLWSFSFPTTSILEIRGLVEIADGNYAVMYHQATNGGTVGIIKISPQGNILMTREYAFTAGGMNGMALSANENGDFGYTFGGGDCAWENFIVKCNANGTIAWSRSYYDPQFSGSQSVRTIISDPYGSFIGSSYDQGGIDAVFWRNDMYGTAQWCNLLPLSGIDGRPRKIAKQSNNTLVMLASDDIDGSDDLLYFFDMQGNLLRQKSYVGSVSVDFRDFCVGASDVLYLTGYHTSGPDSSRMVIMKTDPLGTPLWYKLSTVVASALSSVGTQVAYTPSGNIAIVGSTTGPQLKGTVAVLDQSGNGLCVEEPVTIDVPSMGTITPLPMTLSYVAAPATVTPVNPPFTFFTYDPVLKCGTIVGEMEALGEDLNLYPNPGKGRLHLVIEGLKGRATVSVYAMNGQMVLQQADVTEGTQELDLRHLPAGTYKVVLQDEDRYRQVSYVLQ